MIGKAKAIPVTAWTNLSLPYIAEERTLTYSKHISRDRYPANLLVSRSDLQKTQLPLLLHVGPCLQSCCLVIRWSNPFQYKHRISAHRYPCFEWDSNPRSQCSSRRGRFMPYTARPLWWPFISISYLKHGWSYVKLLRKPGVSNKFRWIQMIKIRAFFF
jgi:hypothetical protein